VLQQFREACVRLVRFREVLDVECPRAIAALDRKIKALENYRNTTGPRGQAASGSGDAPAVTRQLDDADESAETAAARETDDP